MNISLQQIHYILRLAEHKNFGKAAQVCFVTQPTLSMQVKKAEEALGNMLFYRDRNPIEITEFGANILPHLYEMQNEASRIQRLVEQSKGLYKEEIRIAIIPTVAAYLVPEIFAKKKQFSTQVKWAIHEMKTDEILDQLERKKIDLGILAGPIKSDLMQTIPLYNEEIQAYIPSEKGKKIHVKTLEKSQPWLLNQGNCLRTQMIHFCSLQDSASDQDWNYEGGNMDLLIKMVNQYGGYTLVPTFYKELYPSAKLALKHIYSINEKVSPARNIIAISSNKNANNPVILELLSFIKMRYANKTAKKFEVLSWK